MIEPFSLHPTKQQASLCYHSFLTVTQSYHSKVTPICALRTDKEAESVLLYVFRLAFPVSLFHDIVVIFKVKINVCPAYHHHNYQPLTTTP